MDYGELFARIGKGEISGTFLFHGKEEYIKQRALEAIKALINPDARDMNISEYRSPAIEDVRHACQTPPFFSDRRMVILHEMADSDLKQLFPHIETIPNSTTLIIYHRSTMKKDVLKLFNGIVVSFNEMDKHEATRFIEKRARERGISIDRGASAMLVDMAGTQAHNLENEFTKAADYVMDGGTITPEVLNICVTAQAEYQFFRVLDQLISGNKADAMSALRHTLRDDSSNAFGMAHFFTGQLKNMLSAKLLLDQGVKESDIAARIGIKPWSARSAIRAAKLMDTESLRKALAEFAMADYMQISGRMPVDRAVELAVMKYFTFPLSDG